MYKKSEIVIKQYFFNHTPIKDNIYMKCDGRSFTHYELRCWICYPCYWFALIFSCLNCDLDLMQVTLQETCPSLWINVKYFIINIKIKSNCVTESGMHIELLVIGQGHCNRLLLTET